jgi:phospholipase/carboxylesterase
MYEDDAAWSRGACCVAGRSRGNKVTCMEGKSAQTEGRLQARPVAGAAGAPPVGLRPLGSGAARGRLPLRICDLPGGALRPAGGPAARCGRGRARRTGLAPTAGRHDRADPARALLARAYLGFDLEARSVRPGRRRHRWSPGEHVLPLRGRPGARGGWGLLRRGLLRALSLGIANGDLFTHVLGFSPGFMAPTAQVGSPCIFVSHGIRDGWLPIERCSRRIVPQLEHAGYDVTYREFEGGHVVPPEIGREAADWLIVGRD